MLPFALALGGVLIWAWVGSNRDERTPGVADFHAGHYKAAILKLDTYLVQHPPDPCSGNPMKSDQGESAQRYLGRAYLKDHQDQKAIDTLSSPCLGSQEDVYRIGIALMEQGKLKQSRAEFKKSLTMGGGGKMSDSEKWEEAAQAKIDEIDAKIQAPAP